jgi:membrane-bound ClpP family serine protease
MRTARPTRFPRSPRSDPTARLLLTAIAGLALFAAAVPAQEVEPGRVVQVPLPLTTEAVSRLSRATDDALDRFEDALRSRQPADRPVFKLIYDFNPESRPANSNDFGACTNLVDEVRRVQGRGARTIAYVHAAVTRHSVLPVLACDEVVFSPEGSIGEVAEPGRVLERSKRVAYEEVAGSRFSPAVILKMFDRNLAVVKAKLNEPGPRFRAPSDKPDDGPVLAPGSLGLYGFDQARSFGLCQQEPRDTVADVAAAYGVPRSGLEPILARAPVAWTLVVDGPITPELRERLQRRVRRAVGSGANLLIFQLRCSGGDSGAAYDIANYLVTLNDDRPRDKLVKTIAYVTEQASDTALFLALACNEIVMHPKAVLGRFDEYLGFHPDRADLVRQNLEELARRQLYSPVLARGFADQELRIHWAVRKKGASEGRPMTAKDMSDDADSPDPQWRSEWMVKPMTDRDEGSRLTLHADMARKVRLARAVADDVGAIYKAEGVEPSQVHVAGSDWLDDLANFLREPVTSMFLVGIGITCLFLEVKLPGVGLPGIVAAVCFVLFFWSHHPGLTGQIFWLAVLLFFLGLILLGLEIFVLPGFGVCGISGVLLVVGSLGLVAYGHWPRSGEEWAGLGRSTGPFSLSILGAIAAAAMLARYLPHIPYANRLILKPGGETDEFADEPPPAVTNELAGLLGAIGVAATPLRPAGKAQFGDDFVDVVAEGSFVPPGTRVRVIEIEGNRVVVKEV